MVCLHLLTWETLKQFNWILFYWLHNIVNIFGCNIGRIHIGIACKIGFFHNKEEATKKDLEKQRFMSNLKISFNIYSISTSKEKKGDSCCLLHTSPILSMLGWFLYFTKDLILKALCPLEAIEPITLFYRYNFRTHFRRHGLGSIAKFYRFFQVLFLDSRFYF